MRLGLRLRLLIPTEYLVTPDKTELLNQLEKLKRNLASAIDQTLEKNQFLLQHLQLIKLNF